MTPRQFLTEIIEPAAPLLPNHNSPEARCFLLAAAGQESEWLRRLQEPVAYARGFWQSEKNGHVLGVLTNGATSNAIHQVLARLEIPTSFDLVFEAVAWCDPLAYCIARLALLLDPAPLPAIGDATAAWDCYIRVWRPGVPRPSSWPERYGAANALFTVP